MLNLPTPKMKLKLFGGVFALLIISAGFVSYNLFKTSVIKAEYYRAKANNQQLSSFTINANRGTIYDRNGKTLAVSETVWDVILSPGDIYSNKSLYQQKRAFIESANYKKAVKDGIPAIAPAEDAIYDEAEEISRTLSEILEVDYARILDLCKNYMRSDGASNRYEIIKTKISKEQADEINKFKSEKGIGEYSVYLNPNTKRDYPNDALAASVIGFTNYDNAGVYGIEAQYDDYLKGVNGRFVMAKDAAGRAMPYEYEMKYDAKDGDSLVLTIDEVLQHFLEKNLDSAVSQHAANNRATGIIMNPKTGAILAMATSPGFNLNDNSSLTDWYKRQADQQQADKLKALLIQKGKPNGNETDLSDEELKQLSDIKISERELQWKNKAVSELYFPGSVFKVITCASALEEKKISLNSTFYCTGAVQIADTLFHCWRPSGHGTSTLTEALTRSCNPAFVEIGNRLGASKFSDYLDAFGFTQKTGIDLPGEAFPSYMPRDRMGVVELSSSAFGQTNKITPIQMITAYAAVVNGGNLVTPHVVDKILDGEGNVVQSVETTVKRQVISEETSAIMRRILEDVVEYNGGSNAYIAGYRIGGKSGTSQKIDEYASNPGSPMRYVSTFCAFAPADEPEIIMLVCVDDPRGSQYYGSAVAAPVVSAVFKEGLPYLEIYPQYTAEEFAAQDAVVPYIIGMSELDVQTKLNTVGLNARFIGEENGNSVIRTVPAVGQTIAKNGTVVVYLSEQESKLTTVPSVYGMTVSQANKIIADSGLNIKLSGGGIYSDKAKAALQSLDPGTEVMAGTVVEVSFVINDETG